MTIEPLSDIIMAVYESALAPDGWLVALRRIADFSGSDGCRIVIHSDLTGSVIYSVEHGVEYQRAGHLGRSQHKPAPPANGRELVPVGEPFTRSRMTSQLMIAGSDEPWQGCSEEQVFDILSVVLLNSSTVCIFFEAMKTDRRYTDCELERMRLISPHICRAIRISDNLNVSRLTSEMFEASLEALSTGVYFIGQHNRVVYLNRVARAQIKSAKVLQLVDDHLVAADREAHR